jgi:hypothetical protein
MVVLPVAIVLMFVGLRGSLDGVAAGLLLLLGCVGWLVRTADLPGKSTAELSPVDAANPVAAHANAGRSRSRAWGACVSIACAGVLGVIVAAVWGLALNSGLGRGAQFTPAVMGMAILAPAMMFPLVGLSSEAAKASVSVACGLLVRTALGLLTVVLPLVILASGPGRGLMDSRGLTAPLAAWVKAGPAVLWQVSDPTTATTQPDNSSPAMRPADPSTAKPQSWPTFPVVSWRLDSAVLVVAGMMLIGLHLGLVRGGRRLGALAVCGYAIYLVAGVVVAVML